ncbi:phosphatase PAP2 family protein [Pseudorhodobacter sp.]|uniref:phosphatase PAP2 family protein n=1 Tax=Pseudorhodobacter sp. TaxID=1934400 RepID=UPI0026475208|nr:phosphatase PAP2 family protein [Pseudorhodobacter sp.]MDN5787083.1 phosphatase PAP2 family protein [Pseudorhodobacter sp.]
MAQTSEASHGLNFNRAASRCALSWLAGAFAVAIAVFALFPQLDIATSTLFGGASGFPLRPSPLWEDVRQFFIIVTNGSAVLLLGYWLVLRLRNPPQHGRSAFCQIAGFGALAYLIVPGVLVNGMIKPLWARARPYNVDMFGGTFGFTSPFELGGQCHGSCSFVSGETSALFTCATVAALFFAPMLAAKWRMPALWVIWGMAVFGSLLRIAVGAHFLSDVVFSAILSSAMVLALALRLSVDPKERKNQAMPAKITAL